MHGYCPAMLRTTTGLLVLLLFGLVAQAEEPAPLTVERRVTHPGGIEEVLFENGLVLLASENRAAPVIATRVFVKIGSIYEGDMLGTGVSHYFEHIISGGSTRVRTEAESKDLLQSIGNNSNAYTSRDLTVYFINTEARHFGTAADLLGDYMVNNVIAPEEFARERGVIIQEIRKNQDNPQRRLFHLMSSTMFPDHPAGQPVIGHLPLFKEVTREQVERFYRRYYVANNTVVVTVGDVPVDKQIETIARTFVGFQRGTPNHPQMPSVPRQMSARWAEERTPMVAKTFLAMGHHTVSLDHPDLFALDVAADILGSGRTSRLYQALRAQGIVLNVYAYSHTPVYNAGVFGIGAVLDDEKAPQALTAIVQEINRMKTEPVSPEELRRAIRNKVTSEAFRNETVEDQSSDIGYTYLHAGDPNFTDVYLEGIRSVTVEDVQRVVRQYLTDANRTVALVRPERKEAAGDAEDGAAPQASDQAPADAEDAADKAPAGAVELVRLDNGVRVLFSHDPNVRSVLVQATFRGGVLAENAQNRGVSRLMATLLLRGTEDRDAQTFHGDVENLGARIYSDSGNNSWYAGLKLLPEDLETGLETLAEVVFRPRFAEEDLKRERGLQLMAIKGIDDSWEEEAQHFFRKKYFAGHPYAHEAIGTPETVAALDRKAVAAFHRSTLLPGECVVAIFGNVERDAAITVAKRLFGDFPVRGDAAAVGVPEGPESTPTGVAVKENAKSQVVLMWGYPGLPFGAEDIPALTVLDAVLSGYGYPSGRLHEALRGEADLVYFVHAWNWAGLGTGVFQIMTQTAPENVEKVRSAVLKQVADLRTNPVSAEELDRARESVVISDALGNQSPRSRALRATYDELYGMGFDYHDAFAERIRAVTAEDVLRIAKKVFASEQRFLAATGPKEAVAVLATEED